MAHKPRLNHTAPARTKHFIVYQEPVTLYYTSWIFQAPLNYRRIIAGTIISDRGGRQTPIQSTDILNKNFNIFIIAFVEISVLC